MDKYETLAKYNIAETCCASISVNDLRDLSEDKTSNPLDPSTKFTYGAIRGSKQLRESLANLYSEDAATPLAPENVLITTGAIQANFLLLYTLVGPGDHVICHYPTYQQLYSVPASLGAEVSLWKAKEADRWKVDIDELKNLIRPNTKLIILKYGSLFRCAWCSTHDVQQPPEPYWGDHSSRISAAGGRARPKVEHHSACGRGLSTAVPLCQPQRTATIASISWI